MRIVFFLLLTITLHLRADKTTNKLVTIETTRQSLSGGPAEDVMVKAAEYLTMPELKERGQPHFAVLQRKFPTGTNKIEILEYLKKIQTQHPQDTELLDYLAIISGSSRDVPCLSFKIITMTRVSHETPEINEPPDDYILKESFTSLFKFSATDELIEVLSSRSSRPLETLSGNP